MSYPVLVVAWNGTGGVALQRLEFETRSEAEAAVQAIHSYHIALPPDCDVHTVKLFVNER